MGNNQLKHISRRSLVKGYTLLGLLVTTSIVAILSSVAVPSLASLISDAHIRSASTQLLSTLMLSRHHAISSGSTVIVCHAKDISMTECSETRQRNTNWSNGLISYADLNRNDTLDQSDHVITTTSNNPKVAIVFNQNGRLRFFSDGSARSAGFYLCIGASATERHLKILHTGRTRTVAEMNQIQRNTCLSKAL